MNDQHDNDNPVAKELPGDFTVKVFIKQPDETATSKLMTVIADALGDERAIAISQRASKKGQYVSFSACFWADSKEQLDHVYRVLHAMPEVVMTL